jgi:hypothetical protein
MNVWSCCSVLRSAGGGCSCRCLDGLLWEGDGPGRWWAWMCRGPYSSCSEGRGRLKKVLMLVMMFCCDEVLNIRVVSGVCLSARACAHLMLRLNVRND